MEARLVELRVLRKAHADGDLADDEYEIMRAQVVNGKPQTDNVGCVTDIAQAVAKSVASAIMDCQPTPGASPSVAGPSPVSVSSHVSKRPSPTTLPTLEVLDTKRPKTQLSMARFISATKVVNGKRYRLSEPSAAAMAQVQKKVYRCSHCDFHSFYPGPLANHIKVMHPVALLANTKSVAAMFGLESDSIRRQQVRARDTLIAGIIGDMVTAACKEASRLKLVPSKVWFNKRSGNKKNKGASHRSCRSYAFKKKLILEVDRYKEKHSRFSNMWSGIVADLHNVSIDLLNRWIRERDKIFQHAQNRALGKSTRIRKKKGRFHEQEEELHKDFLKERKAGRPVGPRWLRTSMRRKVMLLDTPMSRLFTAGYGWLHRFTRRFGMVLRRKTCIKRVSAKEKEPKIKRYFAVFRRHLLSFKEKTGYRPSSSIYHHENRFSVDAVPAGADSRHHVAMSLILFFLQGCLTQRQPMR